MGMDIYGQLSYGIVLPEDFEEKYVAEDFEDGIYELVEKFNLDLTIAGCHDVPTYIVSTKEVGVNWGETLEITKNMLIEHKNKKLRKFCKKFDLKIKPAWHLSALYSH